MYKVLKPRGSNNAVTVANTGTHASVIVGQISVPMLNILEEAGYKTADDTLNLMEEWDLEVNKEIANKLTHLALKMTKPIRTKEVKKEKKQVDAMDVLLGLANY